MVGTDETGEAIMLARSKKNALWQRALRIVHAIRKWCSKPARVKPLRINRFH